MTAAIFDIGPEQVIVAMDTRERDMARAEEKMRLEGEMRRLQGH